MAKYVMAMKLALPTRFRPGPALQAEGLVCRWDL